jgi:hypothetical protein
VGGVSSIGLLSRNTLGVIYYIRVFYIRVSITSRLGRRGGFKGYSYIEKYYSLLLLTLFLILINLLLVPYDTPLALTFLYDVNMAPRSAIGSSFQAL